MREHPELAAAIERLPGRKLIFTNGSRAHAERVAGKLGVLHCFEGIFDICDADYVPKPTASCYDHFCSAHGVDAGGVGHVRGHAAQPGGAARARHDDGAGALGVHLRPPVQQKIRAWVEPPEHVHHMTEDLALFLGDLPKTGAAVPPPSAG